MTQANPQAVPQQVSKAAAFKKKYKLEGMIASVIVMWLDYFFIHQGLIANDLGIVTSGMAIMFVGGAIAYYFS